MSVGSIKFNTVGHDGFIDFIKAYAIICVLIGHAIPESNLDLIGYGLWAGMQVPLFVLVQAFHGYKKNVPTINLEKIFKRVFLPFFVVEFFLCVILLLSHSYSYSELIPIVIRGGGIGPGSYFPWIYLQIALLIPLFSLLLGKCPRKYLGIVFILICESMEYFFALIHISEDIYRLLAFRYILLLFFGWLWVKEGITLNWKTLSLSIISLLSIVYFEYVRFDNEPFFLNTGWRFHRWPCYYYVAYLGTMGLHAIYKLTSKFLFLRSFIGELSKCSYDIFLFQMAIALVLPHFTKIIVNPFWHFTVYFILFSSISILGGFLFNRIWKRVVQCINDRCF